jgi:glutamine amidotransferase
VIDDTAAVCEYGIPFSAAAERSNVSAVQFHPEKSGEAGLRILRNWLTLAQ